MARHPVIGFRPTDQIQKYIDVKVSEDPNAVKSELIIDLCHKALKPVKMIEQKNITGLLIPCAIRPHVVPYGFSEYLRLKAPVDSSVCKSCSKYPCDSWEDIASIKRISQKTNRGNV